MLYTITQAAAKLQLSTKTLRRWEHAGKLLPSRTLGGQRRYSLDELQVLDAIKNGLIVNARDLLTERQAASFLGVDSVTLKRYLDQGLISPLITSSGTYYPKSRLLSHARVATPLPEHPAAAPRESSLAPIPPHSSPTTMILTQILITLIILLLYQVISHL